MQYDKIFYSNGIPCRIAVALPEDMADGRLPAVVLCHGHSRHHDDGLDALSDVLVRAGFVTARFDFRGCGCEGNRYALYCASEWPRDLVNALNYVSALPMVDPARIGVAGISMGAATTVYVSGMDARIHSAVSMSGIGDCRMWLENYWKSAGDNFARFEARVIEAAQRASITGHRAVVPAIEMYRASNGEIRDLLMESFKDNVNAFVALDSIQDMLNYRPLDRCRDIQCPILFLHGAADDIVAVEQSKMMYESAGTWDKEIIVYPETGHNLPLEPNRDKIFSDIRDWFLRTL